MEYPQKAHRADEQFAHDKPELWRANKGPFELALSTFMSGGPIPVVFGAFGEFNTSTTDKLVKRLAAIGAKTPAGINLSPHPDKARGKPGPTRILTARYRQALGVMAVRTYADLKLNRIRFVRRDRHVAQRFARAQANWYDDTGHRRSRAPWFASHFADPYHAYNSFAEGARARYAFL